MKKNPLFTVIIIVTVAVTVSFILYSRHEEGVPLQVDKNTQGKKEGLALRRSGNLPYDDALGRGSKLLNKTDHQETDWTREEEAYPDFSEERNAAGYENWLGVRKEIGRPDGIDQEHDDPFKEHLSHLFLMNHPHGSEPGGSNTECALALHPLDAGYQQGTAALPSFGQETSAEANMKSSLDHKDRGVYAERGLSHMADDEGEGSASLKSAKNGRVGYRFSQALALQVGLDYIPGLPGYEFSKDSPSISSSDAPSLDVTTYTSSLKFSPDLGSKTTRPYVVGGFGLMHADAASDTSGPALWFIDPNYDSEMSTSGKIGLGLEFRKDNTSLGIEANLGSGFGDLADVVYQTWNMGLTLHW